LVFELFLRIGPGSVFALASDEDRVVRPDFVRRCKLRREIDAPVAGNWTGVVAGLLPMSRDCPGQLFFGLRGSDRVSGRVVSFYV
jgi:hypothetical protein